MSMFNGSSVSAFGPKPIFGGFGSTTQSSPFGSSFAASSQPAFGAPSTPTLSSSLFGASNQPDFGAPSTVAFGSSSTPNSGATSTPAIDAPNAPAFGATSTSTPTFGSTPTPTLSTTGYTFTPAFGCIPFGATSTAFGAQSSPSGGQTTTPASGTPEFGQPSAFGSSSSSAVGSTTTPASGATTTPASGATTAPTFGATSTPAFGSTSPPTFGTTGLWNSTPSHGLHFGAATSNSFGSTPAPSPFGSSPASNFGAISSPFSFWLSQEFGCSPFGATSTAFGTQSSPFGGQTTTPAIGNPGFVQPSFRGQQRGGTRVTSYAQTAEADSSSGTRPAGMLQSISAMPAYKDKSHEVLRWDDYQSGYKGPPNPAAQSSCGMDFNMNNTQRTSVFDTQAQGTHSIFGICLNSGSSQSSPLFQSTTPALGQTSSPLGQAGQSTPAFGQSNELGGNMLSSTPSLLSTSSMGFDHTTPSLSVPLQSVQPTQNIGGFGFASTAPDFGASSTPAFDASSTPASAASSTNAVGSSPSPIYPAPSSSYSSTSSVYGQSTSGYRMCSFGATSSPFGHQTTTPAFGASSTPGFGASSTRHLEAVHIALQAQPLGLKAPRLTTTPAFGSPGFGQPSFECQQRGGTRVNPYAQTHVVDSGNAAELESISAIPAYKEKSHEELRWEDYQLGDKGTPTPAAQSYGIGLNFQSALSSPLILSITPTLGQTSSPFGYAAPIFRQSTPAFGQSNAFGGSMSPFFRQSMPAFGQSNAFAGNMFSSTPSLLSTISMGFNQPTGPIIQLSVHG